MGVVHDWMTVGDGGSRAEGAGVHFGAANSHFGEIEHRAFVVEYASETLDTLSLLDDVDGCKQIVLGLSRLP